jgi:REP element-mobilizing transposase RayT
VAFKDRKDRNKFLYYLRRYVELFQFRIHAWCLMPNHFHLLLESGEAPYLSEFMRRLLTAYTIYFNRRHDQRGHLFQGRFQSRVVDKSDYLVALSRYIHLNPTHGAEKAKPEEYEGSSLKYYIMGSEPPFLHTAEILSWFGGSRKDYALFIKEGLKEDLKPLVLQQRYIGGEAFVRRMNQRLKLLRTDGSGALEAARRRRAAKWETEQCIACLIRDEVAIYFGCSPERIINCRYARDSIGKARLVLIGLLRNFLPWTGKQITEFLHLNGGLDVHLKRLREEPEAAKALEIMNGRIKDKLRT